ncbi:MAG TPA: hypothetical protein VGJ77_09575 [Gaiellaceae bacterium]|jgi:hypothetical protein
MTTQLKKSIAVGVATVMIAALAVVFVVGRGGGSTASAAGQGLQNGGAPPSSGGFADFEACMAKSGVTLTRGKRPDFRNAKVQQALQACRQLRPGPPSGRNGPLPGGALPDGTTPPRPVAPSTQNGQTAPTT